MPAAGGTRLLLVATDPDTDKRAQEDRSLAAAPAQPGMVVIGEQSRFVFEFGDGSLSVFNLLQLIEHGQNTSHAAAADRVRPAQGRDRHDDPEGLVAAGDGRGHEGHRRRPVRARRHEHPVRVLDALLGQQPDRRTADAGSAEPRDRSGAEDRRHAPRLRADDRAARDGGRRTDVCGRPGTSPPRR